MKLSRLAVLGGGTAILAGSLMAPPVLALADPGDSRGDSPEVTVSVDTRTNDAGVTTFSGDVSDGPGRGMVYLQERTARQGEPDWRTVLTSDFTPDGYQLRYPADEGVYRVSVPLETWYNTTGWYDREHGEAYGGPASAASKRVRIEADSGADSGRRWVVGLGDSYMSGDGASYAGYGPWCGNHHDNVLPWKDCKKYDQDDRWWISAFGSSLKQTYPGDYAQPIAQPGLGNDAGKYSVDLSGVKCHRSSSALMFWNRPDYAGMNFACSGAVVDTRLSSGKPGIDFVEEQTQKYGRIVGQALQLQRFAQQVQSKGDSVSVVSLSIGGNDVGFADIVSDCVKRFLVPTQAACWKKDSGSEARKAYNDGNGLTKAKDAVLTAGRNIVKALDTAGARRGDYTIAVQSPPIGLPPASEFESDFGGDSGYGRQGIGGCGFTDGDLNFFNGDFGKLLRKRMIEGASALKKEFPDVKFTVVDATKAVSGHQLCSKQVSYPATRKDGNNTLTPAWYGDWGGQRGTWMTPIIVTCMGFDWGPVCTKDTSPAVLFPTLWRAVDGSGAYRSPEWVDGVDQLKQLPAHPNFWGQRALATCHSAAATDPAAVGKVMACSPGRNGLDAYGRPAMKVEVDSPL